MNADDELERAKKILERISERLRRAIWEKAGHDTINFLHQPKR